jgi:putative transposase
MQEHLRRDALMRRATARSAFQIDVAAKSVLPSAETAAMLFWALLDSGQIIMRKVDGWETLAERPCDETIDLAA